MTRKAKSEIGRRLCRNVARCMVQGMEEADVSFATIDARLGKKSGYAKKFLIDLLEGEDKDLRSVSEVMFACDGSILVPSIVRAPHVAEGEPKP